MGKSKPLAKPPPALYRDVPDRDDTAATSSAVLLSDIEYPEEETPLRESYPEDELPPYSDVAEGAQSTSHGTSISYLVSPLVPDSCLSKDQTTIITHRPLYSQDPVVLESMIREQAAYPPNFALRLRGTHTETYKTRDQKKERKTITDFDIRVNMTHLLVCPNPGHARDPAPCNVGPALPRPHDPPQELPTPSCKYMKFLGADEKGYRGTILKTIDKSPSEPEVSPSLTNWCEAYVSDPHFIKNFVIRREITHHEAERLEGFCRNLISSTSYRGHTSITFETTHQKILVCSPGHINQWRYNVYISWFCYLTFLWIFTWPFLFFATKRYEAVTAVFPYRIMSPGRYGSGKPLVQSEDAFFNEWKQALTRAVLAQHQGWVDAIYREETAEMARSGNSRITVQSTENSLGGLLAGAVSLAMGLPRSTGWGADSYCD